MINLLMLRNKGITRQTNGMGVGRRGGRCFGGEPEASTQQGWAESWLPARCNVQVGNGNSEAEATLITLL